MPEQQRDCAYSCRVYRIPFRWSKAGIMEAGCSDMRATTNCNTSCRFSSCRKTISVKRLERHKYKTKQVKADYSVFVLCLDSHYECKCSKDIMHIPDNCITCILQNIHQPLVRLPTARGLCLATANRTHSFIVLSGLNTGKK